MYIDNRMYISVCMYIYLYIYVCISSFMFMYIYLYPGPTVDYLEPPRASAQRFGGGPRYSVKGCEADLCKTPDDTTGYSVKESLLPASPAHPALKAYRGVQQ